MGGKEEGAKKINRGEKEKTKKGTVRLSWDTLESNAPIVEIGTVSTGSYGVAMSPLTTTESMNSNSSSAKDSGLGIPDETMACIVRIASWLLAARAARMEARASFCWPW